MTRIGILGHGFIEWGGGLDFLRLLCGGLQAADPSIELHLILPVKGPRLTVRRSLGRIKRTLKRLCGLPVGTHRVPTIRHITDLLSGADLPLQVHSVDIGLQAVRQIVREQSLDALLPAISPLPANFPIPWLGYLPDLQHKHFPQFFAATEIQSREHRYRQLLEQAPGVLVNAQAVRDDIAQAYPGLATNVIAMPFAPAPNPSWLAPVSPPLEKYGIAKPYFIISNQFWQHKDHETAWRALAQLRLQHPSIELVCTGDTHDYRNPAHFDNLGRLAQELGISGQLRILGLIPKAEQIALLRHAIAVIQPTQFEGGPGGGSVFDAVGLGVPALVSDIPVNLEIREPSVRFFAHRNPDDLAQLMAEQLRAPPGTPIEAKTLIAQGHARRQRCGETILNALRKQTAARP